MIPADLNGIPQMPALFGSTPDDSGSSPGSRQAAQESEKPAVGGPLCRRVCGFPAYRVWATPGAFAGGLGVPLGAAWLRRRARRA
jgi:hypothetical protein